MGRDPVRFLVAVDYRIKKELDFFEFCVNGFRSLPYNFSYSTFIYFLNVTWFFFFFQFHRFTNLVNFPSIKCFVTTTLNFSFNCREIYHAILRFQTFTDEY